MVTDQIPQDDSALQTVPASPPQTVELLPGPVLPALARPLAIIGGHTYAAVWPYVRRPDSPPSPISRELIFVRDDGRLLLDPARRGAPACAPSLPPAPRADSVLAAAASLLPPHCLWSPAGLQRYLDGRRPHPADVFGRLVAVLDHFIDFTDSLAEPALTAEFLAVYLLTTWFAPAFPVHGLLWITGDHGAGKSRLLYLLARLAHLGLPFPGLPSHTALLDLAGLGAALAVDDAYFFSANNRGAPAASSAAGRQAFSWPAASAAPSCPTRAALTALAWSMSPARVSSQPL